MVAHTSIAQQAQWCLQLAVSAVGESRPNRIASGHARPCLEIPTGSSHAWKVHSRSPHVRATKSQDPMVCCCCSLLSHLHDGWQCRPPAMIPRHPAHILSSAFPTTARAAEPHGSPRRCPPLTPQLSLRRLSCQSARALARRMLSSSSALRFMSASLTCSPSLG